MDSERVEKLEQEAQATERKLRGLYEQLSQRATSVTWHRATETEIEKEEENLVRLDAEIAHALSRAT